jgi:hypothetical protein
MGKSRERELLLPSPLVTFNFVSKSVEFEMSMAAFSKDFKIPCLPEEVDRGV